MELDLSELLEACEDASAELLKGAMDAVQLAHNSLNHAGQWPKFHHEEFCWLGANGHVHNLQAWDTLEKSWKRWRVDLLTRQLH